MSLIPYVLEKTSKGERLWDLPSRLMEDRVIFVGEEINAHMANIVVQQLLFLDSRNDEPIHMYVNSPGGSVSAGLAIIDTMNYISAPVHTYCIGSAASMGAMILACGEKGHRYSLPFSEVMIHQPSAGIQGQITDMEIHTKHAKKLKEILTKLLQEATGQDLERLKVDMERDYYLDAKEALEYGLVDEILSKKVITEDE